VAPRVAKGRAKEGNHQDRKEKGPEARGWEAKDRSR
jgi:hypothetical protein